MKQELMTYLDARIIWHRSEQHRLKVDDRHDEATHMQIAVNVYHIFLSTYQAMKFDLGETLQRFSSIMSTWEESHKRACEHAVQAKALVEEIKLSRAQEIICYVKELEANQHD